LAEVSQTLASTLDYESTLASLASLLVPQFADWYAVDILDDDGHFRRLAVVHSDPAKTEWAEKSRDLYPPDLEEAEGTGRAARTGEAVLYRTISDELLRSSTKDSTHYEILHELGMASAMVVPLIAAGRTFGGLMSSRPSRSSLRRDDLEFAKHLDRRAAVAVGNARLYRAPKRARAAVVVEHVADGVLLVDQNGIIRLWNPAAEEITGLAAADTVGKSTMEVFSPWESIADLVARGEPRPQTQPLEINGRELWLSITGVAFEGGTVFAFRDLTAERAVEKLKSDFVSTVSHELRTPLAAIYGAALTLRREDVPLGEPQRSGLLEVIASESDRLARIVNDILWASRLESGTMQTTIEKCDGVEIARSVVETARHYIPPNIQLTIKAPKKAPLVAADPDKARQVLTNLNAVKYSPDGGKVTVEVAVADRNSAAFATRDSACRPRSTAASSKVLPPDPNLTRGVAAPGSVSTSAVSCSNDGRPHLGRIERRRRLDLLRRASGRCCLNLGPTVKGGWMGAVVWAEPRGRRGRRRNGGTRRGRQDLRLTQAQALAQGNVRGRPGLCEAGRRRAGALAADATRRPEGRLVTSVSLDRRSGRRSFVHVGTATCPVPRTAPGLPEHQREQDARQPDPHQDPTHCVDVDRP
jgi:PAS domain S-box-containing protein